MSEYIDLLQDGGGTLQFPLVQYRRGAPFTAPFGLDGTFGKLRLHMGVDRGPGSIYAPFRCQAEFAADLPTRFGNLLTLSTPYGFDIRIAHMKKLDPAFARLIASRNEIPAGTYIGEAGREGSVVGIDGRHTHTEIVSHEASSIALDSVLAQKFGRKSLIPYSQADAEAFCAAKCLAGDPMEMYGAEITARNISFMNDMSCDRIDYLSGKRKRFYSSQALFNF